ncbi:YdcF family protein [Paenibacillus algorifonticola]|uniref:YdcF family protein n=1 Tax=Paenibacillus algorifonticola TaxID=684063 RepID=UPI003D2C29E4
MKKRLVSKKIKPLLLCVLAVVATVLCWFSYEIWSFSIKDEARPADAILVLGTAVWGDQPSPVLRERLNHAIKLYEQGYAKYIIFTGGRGSSNELAESEVSRSYAIEKGVQPEHILIEEQSLITEENFEYSLVVAKPYELRTFIIVSDPLHMKRALMMASELEMTAYSSPTTTSAYSSMRTKLPFFFRELFYYTGYRIIYALS